MKKTCPKCGSAMKPLFISDYCPSCDDNKSTESTGTGLIGYCVWRNRPWGSNEYVFKTVEDAERWRVINGLHGRPVIEVEALAAPFQWKKSGGYSEDLCLADHLYEIYDSNTSFHILSSKQHVAKRRT